MKIAQMQEITQNSGLSVFLLDDFMTDFDAVRARTLLMLLLKLNCQLIFTCPTSSGPFEELLKDESAQHIRLTP